MFTYNYPRPALTVDAIVFFIGKLPITATLENQDEINTSTQVLLIRRGKEPFKDKWALPGGFVEMDELLEEACKRELLEETGVRVEKMNQFKTYDEINRDPRHRTISVIFTAQLESRPDATAGDDAAQADWYSLANLPDLAFDHAKILDDFKKWLGKKADKY